MGYPLVQTCTCETSAQPYSLYIFVIYNAINTYLLSMFFFLGYNDSQTHCVWEYCPVLWREEKRRRPYSSMDCLRQTLPQRGYVQLCEESSFQTTRKLCQSQQSCDQATLRSYRDRLGRV